MNDPEEHKTIRNRIGLPGFAIRRPVTIGMLFISLLVVGAVAWRGIPLRLLPQGLDLPYLWIWISYPNASPIENQERIGVPVEEALWTVKGVKRIHSRSSQDRCRVQMEFDQNVNMDVAYMAVRDRLERVRPELPDDQRYIYIYRYSETDEPILYFGISITGNYDDPYRLMKEEVVRPLEQIDGVASVEIWGGQEKMIRIEFLLDRLKTYNIDIGQLMSQLQRADFAIAGGSVHEGGRELMVRANGRLSNLKELAALPVRGSDLHLSDIANVTYSAPTQRWIQRIGREAAVQFGVYKESDVNSVEIAEKLNNKLKELQQNPLLSGLQFDILFDQGQFIRESVGNLQEAGIWGALFAVAVLFFFLRRFRMTLLITLAIPLSLLVTVTCLYFMNWSMNIVTLSALMICVGLVVDNAIVVVENIQTLKQQGYSTRHAAVAGASEVGQAITIATLTTAVVFLPMILMSGDRIFTFYMLRIGLPVIIALVVSLGVALLFIPLAVQKFALSGHAEQSKLISSGGRFVERIVRRTLKRRRDAFLILILLLASTSFPMNKVVSTDQEEGHINDFRLRFQFPTYYSLNDVDSTMQQFENAIYEKSEEYGLKTVVTGLRRGFGRMRVFLVEEPDRIWFMWGIRRLGKKLGIIKDRRFSREEIAEDFKENFKVPPDVEIFTSWSRGGSEDAVYVSVYGDNTMYLLEIAEDIKRRLELIPEAISVEKDLEESAAEVRIRFDRDRTARFGVDPAEAAMGLNALIRGVNLPEVRYNGHEIEISAELHEKDRATLTQVMNLPVSTGNRGAGLRIDDVADVGYGRGLGEITRENRRTRIRLKITTTEDDFEKLSGSIDASLANLSLPPGYDWAKGRRFEDVAESTEERSQAWMLAVMFVFLLMGALFESVLLPWCVIVTVPFSFLGVWWFLFLTGTQFGLMAGIGVIILIGVVVNNAIVLVDRVNTLRKTGLDRDEALAVASRQRFRPIAMTALTTIMGLMPMAIGNANLIGIPYAPMGRAIIGGMLTATITTPVVVPLVYSLVDDLQKWFKAYFAIYKNKAKSLVTSDKP